MHELSTRRPQSVQMALVRADFSGWPKDDVQSVYEGSGFSDHELDALCFKIETRYVGPKSEIFLEQSGRNRFYDDLAPGTVRQERAIISHPDVEDKLRGNELCRFLMGVPIVRGVMDGMTPEQMFWPGGIWGRKIAAKYHEYWMRPVTVWELMTTWSIKEIIMTVTPRLVFKFAARSWWNAKGSWTGLYCPDRRRGKDIQKFIQSFVDEGTMLYQAAPGEFLELPVVIEKDLAWLLECARLTTLDELC